MKHLAFTLLASVALSALPAHAGTRVAIAFNVGSPACPPPPAIVRVTPAPVIACPPPVRAGYWTDVVVKSWVPERWIMTRDRWGRPVRLCEPGHFAYRSERVWVDGRMDRGARHGSARNPLNDRDPWNR